MKAYVNNSGTNNVFQTTQYVYGVTTSTSSINSNDLLQKIQYPDTSTGNPGSGTAYAEVYAYDALGGETSLTDRNQTTHAYSYDALGRETSDTVTSVGPSVNNNTLRRVDFNYDSGGHLYQTTGYANTNGSTVRNQTENLYNGLGQLKQQYQEHGGLVNATSSASVQYTYSEMPSGANHSRLTSMTYPDGRVLYYDYGGANGVDGAISRVSQMSEGTSHTQIEGYLYLGLSTIVEQDRSQNNSKLSYIQQAGDTLAGSDGGDQYTGLDRFGRVVDQWWFTNSGTTVTGTIDRFQYGYDPNSNVMFKNNLGPGTAAASFSELYHANGTAGAYDGLNRLTDFRRGTLTKSGSVYDTITDGNLNSLADHKQSFNLDAQGNWTGTNAVSTDGVNQTRTNNQQNQYSNVGGSTLTYDYNGNLTTDANGNTYGYDAWNRLMVVNVPGELPKYYTYDGLNRNASTYDWDTGNGRQFFYNQGRQLIEEDASDSNAGVADEYVWGLSYINDLVERDRYMDSNNTAVTPQRLWAQHDANHNVTSVVDNNDIVVDRFIYDPYGKATLLNSDWSAQLTGGNPVTPGTDAYEWTVLFQGAMLDTKSGLYTMGFRQYSTSLGRWIEQDPAGYVDGANLYQFLNDNPSAYTDPLGLTPILPHRDPEGGGDIHNGDPEIQFLLQELADVARAWGALQLFELNTAGMEQLINQLIQEIQQALQNSVGRKWPPDPNMNRDFIDQLIDDFEGGRCPNPDADPIQLPPHIPPDWVPDPLPPLPNPLPLPVFTDPTSPLGPILEPGFPPVPQPQPIPPPPPPPPPRKYPWWMPPPGFLS